MQPLFLNDAYPIILSRASILHIGTGSRILSDGECTHSLKTYMVVAGNVYQVHNLKTDEPKNVIHANLATN